MYKIFDTKTETLREICYPEELETLLHNTLEFYVEEKINAQRNYDQTKEEIAATIKNEYEEENKRLIERLQLSYGQFNSAKELNDYNVFRKKHIVCCPNLRYAQSKEFYIKPYCTGIGTGYIVVCPWCGKEEDITDTRAW